MVSTISPDLSIPVWVLLCFCAGFIGAKYRPGAWYDSLKKPSWNPPKWLFPVAWSLLYFMMGTAAGIVWNHGAPARDRPLALFLSQIVLNALWSWIFFGRRKMGLALADLLLLCLFVAVTTIAFFRISPLAGRLMVPYLAWILFAAYLNFTIWRLNGRGPRFANLSAMTEERRSTLGHGYTRNDRRSARPMLGICLSFLGLGIVIGGWMFSQTQSRFILSIKDCDNCMTPAELAGLVGSVGVQKLGGALPFVVAETDKSIVIKHPFPYARIHYVVIPKKDIKDIGRIADEDMPYLQDAFAVMRSLIDREHLHGYRIFTNGPGLQSVGYLHFHLISNDRNRETGRVESELSMDHSIHHPEKR